MATVHTLTPEDREGHHQEYRVAKTLETMADDELHLWFDVNYLNNRDIDLLIYHERAGVFVVEIKGVKLGDIRAFGMGQCTINGRDTNKTPQQQAMEAMYDLKNCIGSHNAPRMIPTVLWPRIKRQAWRDAWSTNSDVVELADKFLFQDDLEGGPRILSERLECIRRKPPIGSGIDLFRHSKEAFDAFNSKLTRVSTP